MKQLLRLGSLAVAVGVMLVTAATAAAKTVALHERDTGQRVTLSPGDTLVIYVKEPEPGSPFNWRVRNYDRSLLRPLDLEGRVVRIKGALERQFSFQASRSGVSDVVLSLERRGLLQRGVAKTFRAQVRVEGGGYGPGHGHDGHYHGLTGHQVVVSEKHDHSHLRLTVGDTLIVRLDAKGPSSYHWALDRPVASMLRQMGPPRTYKKDKKTYTEFQYQVVRPGRTQVSLSFHDDRIRGKDPNRRNFEVTVEAYSGHSGPGRPRR